MKKFFKMWLNKIKKYILTDIKKDNEVEKLLLAKILIENIKNKVIVNNLAEVEFKVFSQFG